MEIEVVPQPRVDLLVRRADTGADARRTEYSGTIWVGGGVEISGPMLRRIGPPGISYPNKDVDVFLPDCLPYRGDALGDAVLQLECGFQAAGEQAVIAAAEATFVPDPRGDGPTWIRLRMSLHAGWPCAVTYRVIALTATAACP